MWNTIFIAQAAPQGSFIVQMFPLILIFGVFYFLVIRPQQKQRRAHQELLGALKKDDEVITSGGILGTIEKVDGQILTVRIARDTRIKVLRAQVEGLQSTLLAAANATGEKAVEEKAADKKDDKKDDKKEDKKEEKASGNKKDADKSW